MRIYNAAINANSGVIVSASDENNCLHGALFIVWDNERAYDLISTLDPAFRKIWSSSLLVKEAIMYVSKYVDMFDFEGSMVRNIEKSFRQFGTVQQRYFYIQKTNSKLVKLIRMIRGAG